MKEVVAMGAAERARTGEAETKADMFSLSRGGAVAGCAVWWVSA